MSKNLNKITDGGSPHHCQFYPRFLEASDFSNQFSLPLEVRKIGIPLYLQHVQQTLSYCAWFILLDFSFRHTSISCALIVSRAFGKVIAFLSVFPSNSLLCNWLEGHVQQYFKLVAGTKRISYFCFPGISAVRTKERH